MQEYVYKYENQVLCPVENMFNSYEGTYVT